MQFCRGKDAKLPKHAVAVGGVNVMRDLRISLLPYTNCVHTPCPEKNTTMCLSITICKMLTGLGYQNSFTSSLNGKFTIPNKVIIACDCPNASNASLQHISYLAHLVKY